MTEILIIDISAQSKKTLYKIAQRFYPLNYLYISVILYL